MKNRRVCFRCLSHLFLSFFHTHYDFISCQLNLKAGYFNFCFRFCAITGAWYYIRNLLFWKIFATDATYKCSMDWLSEPKQEKSPKGKNSSWYDDMLLKATWCLGAAFHSQTIIISCLKCACYFKENTKSEHCTFATEWPVSVAIMICFFFYKWIFLAEPFHAILPYGCNGSMYKLRWK